MSGRYRWIGNQFLFLEDKEFKLRMAIEECKNTKVMQEHYDKEFLKEVKENLHNLNKEERLSLLFKRD